MADETTPTAYPLLWPRDWPRSKYVSKAPFSGTATTVRTVQEADGRTRTVKDQRPRQLTVSEALKRLDKEVRNIRAQDVVVSSNLKLSPVSRIPLGNQSEPSDPGVAVYFVRKKPGGGEQRIVLACDKWSRAADNIAAIAKHLEALRGQERWGVGSLDQAFEGYTQLPAKMEERPWWGVLGVGREADDKSVREAWLTGMQRYHPDRVGGDGRVAAQINRAYEDFKVERGIQ